MYARVTLATGQLGKLDEATQIVSNSVVPAARQQHGFKGYYFFVEPTSGKSMVVSLWESEADLRAGEASGYVREQLAKVASMLTSTPVQETYEVSVQHLRQGETAAYARVLTGEAQPGKTGELVQIVSNSVVPAARQQHGYKGFLLLTDHTTGKGMSITLWETEADMMAGETGNYMQEQLAKVANVFSTQVTREAYQVGVQG